MPRALWFDPLCHCHLEHMMDETEREQLAKRLSAMQFNEARREIVKLDRDADMKYWRNTIWDEYHTMFLLPNADVRVTLVEVADAKKLKDDPDASRPVSRRNLLGVKFKYVGAKVEPMDRPVNFKHQRP